MNQTERISYTLIKQMEALLTTLHNEPLSLHLVFESKKCTLVLIKQLVCDAWDLRWAEVLQNTRKESIVFARMSVSYLAKEFTNHTDEEIADFINKTRTTVIANHKQIESLFFVKSKYVFPFLNPIVTLLKQPQHEAETIQN